MTLTVRQPHDQEVVPVAWDDLIRLFVNGESKEASGAELVSLIQAHRAWRTIR